MEEPRPQAVPSPQASSELPTTPVISTPIVPNLKVSLDHLEQLNYAIGDLLTQQNRQMLYNEQLATTVKTLLNRLEQQQQQLTQLQSQATAGANAFPPSPISPSVEHPFDTLEFDHYSVLQLQIQASLDSMVQQVESAEAIELFVRDSTHSLEKQRRIIKNAQETIIKTRMQPISCVFDRFYQVLGRLQAHQGKVVNLKIEGNHVLVDKIIIDKLYEPLLHLVRNAYDHGIETPRERQQCGKEEDAQIQLSAKQEGQRLLISVRDNGRGLNLDAIRQRAIKNHLIAPTQSLNTHRN